MLKRKKGTMQKVINWVTFIPLAIFLLLVILAFVALKEENTGKLPSAFIGKQPPKLTLSRLGSYPQLTQEDLNPINNKITLINFWASWCPPCRVEHPQLEQISLMNDINLFGINYKDKERAALNFLTEFNNPYKKLGSDPLGRNALEWGVYGVPETFIIDRSGRIVFRHAGPITQDIYKKKIQNLLN